MEILEHMKTLKRDGDESNQENKPSTTKVQELMPEMSFWQLKAITCDQPRSDSCKTKKNNTPEHICCGLTFFGLKVFKPV